MQILKIIFYTVASSFIIWLINVSKTGGPHGPYELFSIDFTNTTVVYPVVDDIAESIPIYSAMLNTLTTWTKEVFSRKRFSLKSISLHESGDDHFMFLIEVYSNAKYEQNYSTISSYLNSELVLEVQKYVDVQPPLGWCLSRRQTVIENANVTVQVEWKKYFNNSQFSMHDCFQPWLKRNPEQHASLSRKSRIPHGPYQLFAIDFTNTTTIYATMNKTEEMEQLWELVPKYSALTSMTTNNSSLAHFRKKELDRSFSSHAKNDDYSYELLVEQYTADEDFEFYPKSYRSIEEKAKEEIKLHPNLGWCMGRRRTVIETENITVQLEWKKYIPNNMFSPEDCFQHWLENL